MSETISKAGADYLAERGLDLELALRLGLSSAKGAGGGEALAFAFSRDGATRRKYRTLDREKSKVRHWQDEGGVGCAFNEAVLHDDSLISHPLIITEGEFDAIAAIQCGYLRTISVPDGAPPPAKDKDAARLERSAKYEWLKPLRPLLKRERVETFIIASDGDANGAQLLEDLAVQFGRVSCKYLTYPKAKDPERRGRSHLKDLNEVLEDWGERGVRETIERARFLNVDGVFKMSDLPPRKSEPTWDIGFNLLGENFKPRPGDLSVVTGIPSHGKSTVVTDLWCRVATIHKIRIAWASFEQEPQIDHKRALQSWFCNAPVHRLTPQEIEQADAWIDAHHRFIYPSGDEDVTLDWLLDKSEAAVVQHDCSVIVIDPWNEIEHVRERHLSLTEYVTLSLRKIRRFAKAFKVHVMVVAHPTKAVKG
jgi:twinkle protein